MRDVLALGPQPFTEWAQYPEGDVDDRVTGYGWYYHAHPLRGASVADEHGHFHIFCYPALFGNSRPIDSPKPGGEAFKDGICHLLALSLDLKGRPMAIFAVNRIAAEQWIYPADALPPVIERFAIGPDQPCTEVSAWIGALLRLLAPEITQLLAERDRQLMASRDERNENGKHPLVFTSRAVDLAAL